jgi:multimeric flavodoxin WrbA
VAEADALVLGSPIYFGQVTGEMRSFMERLLFQYLVYDKNYTSLFPKKIATGQILTMNVSQTQIDQLGLATNFKSTEMGLKRIFGSAETLVSTETFQFNDYSKYESSAFNPSEREQRHREVFPEDCRRAYEMGVRFARQYFNKTTIKLKNL